MAFALYAAVVTYDENVWWLVGFLILSLLLLPLTLAGLTGIKAQFGKKK